MMARRRSKNFDLPPGVVRKVRGGIARYYYGRNQVALGHDYTKMLLKVAELTQTRGSTFAEVATEYLASDDYTRLARATQRSYASKLRTLLRVFGAVELDDITPAHVYRYIAERDRKIMATAEKALLSTIFEFARKVGRTSAPNPCARIRGVGSQRKIYVTDQQLEAVLEHADPELKDFLLLTYYTGQDVGRVIRWTAADVRDGRLWNERSKTGEKVQVEVTGPLQPVLARLIAGKVGTAPLFTRSLWTMRRAFWKARKAGGQEWWMRDLRAKAASDLDSDEDANVLLAHGDMQTTAIYRRQRVGRVAKPVMRKVGK